MVWSVTVSHSSNRPPIIQSMNMWHSGIVQSVCQLRFGAKWSMSISEAAEPTHPTAPTLPVKQVFPVNDVF